MRSEAHAMRLYGALLVVFAFIFLQPVSAYSFQEQPAFNDSVRLSLNAQKSAGDLVSIDVVAYNVSNISSAAFDLDFNSSVLEWAGSFAHDPRGYDRGSFFGPSSIYMIGPEIDVNLTRNRNKLVVGAMGIDGSSCSGNGTIMTVKFRSVGNGSSNISFSNNNLILPDMNFSNSTAWYGGAFIYGGEPLQPANQDNPPLVSLDTIYTRFRSSNITLECTASDDYGLGNLTLFTNVTGSWEPYASVRPDDRMWTEKFIVNDLSEGDFVWNCRANDSSGQAAFAESNFSIRINTTFVSNPPLRTNGQPSGNVTPTENMTTTTVTLSIETDVNATCRYSDIAGFSYESMLVTFNETGSTNHSINLTLYDNVTYRFYVRCNDTYGNVNNDDYLINFSVGNVSDDVQPPNITSDTQENVPFGSYAVLSVKTDEDATCRYLTAATAFNSMNLMPSTYFRNHTAVISGLREGIQYGYYVKCSDSRGNVNPSASAISVFMCYEVDRDCSRNVSSGEISSFAQRWEINPSDVSALRLAKALSLWKSGSA